MVYISLKELLPTTLKHDPHDQYVTNGMFLGTAVMALSLSCSYIGKINQGM
jgi:ZIP family zinc transporter